MSIVTQPISLSGFSYSCNGTRGLTKRVAKSESMSWADFRRCMLANMTYEQVNAISPMSVSEYRRRIKEGGYQKDHIRKQAQKVKSICEMYDKGIAPEEIAKAHNLSLKYCKQILVDNGRSCNAFAIFIAKNKDKIHDMAEKNYSVKTMAKELNVDKGYMYDVLAFMQVKTKKERLAEYADDLTKSKLTALLKKYGGLRNTSKATGLSINKIKECAKILNVVI